MHLVWNASYPFGMHSGPYTLLSREFGGCFGGLIVCVRRSIDWLHEIVGRH